MSQKSVILLADKWSEEVPPETKVGGLPLFTRTLLTLSWVGVESVRVITGDYHERLISLGKKRKIDLNIEYVESDCDEPENILSANVLFDRDNLKESLISGDFNDSLVVFTLETKEIVKKAEAYLWKGLRKPLENDGVVAYYLGRPVSRVFSRFLILTPLSPNHVTILSLISALFGAAFVSYPSFILVGALLYWFSFVLDCVDGEVARLKFMGSIFGQWLDTVADDLATTAFSIGLAIVVYKITGNSLYLKMGVVGAVVYLFCSLLIYRVLNKIGVIDTAQYPFFFLGESGAASEEKGFFTWFAYLFRRDVILFVHLIFAALGMYMAMFWLQFGLNIGMSFITLIDQGYRGISGNWTYKK